MTIVFEYASVFGDFTRLESNYDHKKRKLLCTDQSKGCERTYLDTSLAFFWWVLKVLFGSKVRIPLYFCCRRGVCSLVA